MFLLHAILHNSFTLRYKHWLYKFPALGGERGSAGWQEWACETDQETEKGRGKKDELINKDSEFIPTRLAAHCSMLRDTDFLEVCGNSSLDLEIAVNVHSTRGWACKKSSLASLPHWQVWDSRCSAGGGWPWAPVTLPPSSWPLGWADEVFDKNCPISPPSFPSSCFFHRGPSPTLPTAWNTRPSFILQTFAEHLPCANGTTSGLSSGWNKPWITLSPLKGACRCQNQVCSVPWRVHKRETMGTERWLWTSPSRRKCLGTPPKEDRCLHGLLNEGWLLAGKAWDFIHGRKSVSFSKTPKQCHPLELSVMMIIFHICTVPNGSQSLMSTYATEKQNFKVYFMLSHFNLNLNMHA